MKRNGVGLLAAMGLLCVCMLMAGCDSLAIASVKPTDYTSLIATSIATVKEPEVAVVNPTPTPPSTVCTNCKGRGQVGDGRTMVACPVCQGTGKPKGDVGPSFKQVAADAPTMQWVQQCDGRRCTWVQVPVATKPESVAAEPPQRSEYVAEQTYSGGGRARGIRARIQERRSSQGCRSCR